MTTFKTDRVTVEISASPGDARMVIEVEGKDGFLKSATIRKDFASDDLESYALISNLAGVFHAMVNGEYSEAVSEVLISKLLEVHEQQQG